MDGTQLSLVYVEVETDESYVEEILIPETVPLPNDGSCGQNSVSQPMCVPWTIKQVLCVVSLFNCKKYIDCLAFRI
ncbi:MAG: hypothetical protein LBH37_00150 [Oscillospiraceae bacterium]|jgi:hypothetical protein|nr:hypothetical protein [Oscillospiraceae bacterium]